MMNQEQRDRLIERYMGRRMDLSEEGEFLRLLDHDDMLFRMVETERAVGTALLRDRDTIPADDIETRAHLIAMLGALPQGTGALAGADVLPAAANIGMLGGAALK